MKKHMSPAWGATFWGPIGSLNTRNLLITLCLIQFPLIDCQTSMYSQVCSFNSYLKSLALSHPPSTFVQEHVPFQLIDRSCHEPPQQPSLRQNLKLVRKLAFGLFEQLTCNCLHQKHKKIAIVQSFFNRNQVHCQSSHLKLLYFALKYTQDKQLHRYQHLNLESQCRIVFYNCFCWYWM